MSEESSELVEDGFNEVAAAIVAGYESGEMPMPGTEEFTPAFKKWIKVRTVPAGVVELINEPSRREIAHRNRGTRRARRNT